jgi:hypothetical protein
MKFCALLAVSLLIACTVFAQDSEESSRGPDGGTQYFVDGISVVPVAGKPFSGRSTTEWTRTLADGTVVKTHLSTVVVRDSQGRIYRERHHFVPLDSNEQSQLIQIKITDPITHTRTECKVATHRCSVTSYHAPTSFTLRPVGEFDNGKRSLTRESLGSDSMDGLNVVGTRETVTINPGVVGNSQPLVITREFWYSPDLQINLSVTRQDPRDGTQAVRVTDVSRSEPDPAMFQVPAGYVIENLRGPAPAEK